MSELIVQTDDTTIFLLRQKAKQLGLTTDQLVSKALQDVLILPDTEFEEIVQQVLQENAELYRRLA
jgi:antitoxin FitA